jgi:hypothetical protein
MTMLGYNDPHQMLVNLHDTLTGWQNIRRRSRHAPPTAASMHTPPVSGVPGPEANQRREPKPATVIAFHKIGDRIVPIFGDPTEVATATAAPEPPAPPTASPEPPKAPPPTPPPPDFTPQAVEASAPRRTPAAPPTLDLPPPTPPSLVRTEEAATLERVLADHRAQLAQHAALM